MNLTNKMHRVYDERTDETLFTGLEFDCCDWIDEHYPEADPNSDYIWVQRVHEKPSEEDIEKLQEAVDAYGLGYAIQTGSLNADDIKNTRLSELIYKAYEAIKEIESHTVS